MAKMAKWQNGKMVKDKIMLLMQYLHHRFYYG